jgi:hypothetical protein
MLATLEATSGIEATKKKTGHKTASSLIHYVLAVPWLTRLVKDHPPDDRPLLARVVLNYEVEYIQRYGQEPGLDRILCEFTIQKQREILTVSKELWNKGILKQKAQLEFRFWKKVFELDSVNFAISINDFRMFLQQSTDEVGNALDVDAETAFRSIMPNTDKRRNAPQGAPLQSNLQRDVEGTAGGQRGGQPRKAQDSVHP